VLRAGGGSSSGSSAPKVARCSRIDGSSSRHSAIDAQQLVRFPETAAPSTLSEPGAGSRPIGVSTASASP